jgi:hypothetical protein
MRKIIGMTVLAVLVSMSIPTDSMADAKKGKRIYKKKLQKKCGFSGVRFARNHKQFEWEKIYEDGTFPQEARKICPKLDIDKIQTKLWKDLYDFSYKYAEDGIEPNGCND